MEKLKKIIVLILCFAMLLTLCACGSKNEASDKNESGDSDAEENSGNSVSEENTDSPMETMESDYTLSEYLSSGETIWYLLNNLEGKDSSVREIVVLEPNGSMYYASIPGYTLGELEQMEDADIVAMAKENYAESVASIDFGFTPSPEVEESTESGIKGWLVYGDLIESTTNYDDNTVTLEMAEKYTSTFSAIKDPNILVRAVDEEWESIEPIYATLSEWFSKNDPEVASHIFYNFYLYYPAVDFNDTDDVLIIFDVLEENATALNQSEAYFAALYELREVIKEMLSLADIAAKNIYDNFVAQYEEKKADVEPVQYRLAIITDSTGNNTASELLAYQYYESSETLCIRTFELNYRYPVQSGNNETTNCTTVVYDSIYGGYNLSNSSCDVIFTRVYSPLNLQLDAVGTAGLPIDVDANSLFE